MLLDLHENIIVNSNWIFLVKDPYKLIFYFQTPASMELLKLVKNTEIFNSFYASKISLKFPKSLFMVAVEFLEFRIPFFRQSLFSKKRQKDTYHLFLVNTWYIFHSTTYIKKLLFIVLAIHSKKSFLTAFSSGDKKISEMVLFGGFSCYFAKIYYIQKKIFANPLQYTVNILWF